jgi:hypothetical protein
MRITERNEVQLKTVNRVFDMKTSSVKPTGIVRAYRGLALAAALLLAGSLPNPCAAQNSPVGTWDCIAGGTHQPGIAYLTFTTDLDANGNYTFSGYTLMAGTPPSPDESGRNPGGGVGRGDSVTSSSGSGTNSLEFVFGFTRVNGPWAYNEKGHIIGFFTQLLDITSVSAVTNWVETLVFAEIPYVVTNDIGTFDYVATNSLSFSFTNAGFTTNITWTATNSTGSTNQFFLDFLATSSSNFFISNGYVVTNSDGTVDRTGVTNFSVDVTNSILLTNFTWSATSSDNTTNSYSDMFLFLGSYTNITTAASADSTNAVSFEGTVVPGKRLTLKASTSLGKVTYQGVPATTLPNLDGSSWSGDKKQDGQDFVEFFGLRSFSTYNPWSSDFPDIASYPNIYWTTNGMGPGYAYYGIAVLSRQKKIGFTFQELSGTNSTLRSTMGSFKSTSKATTGKTKGVIEPNTSIKFNATKQP